MNNSRLRPTVDWNAYAQKYDMLLDYNPFYQEAYQQILETLQSWKIEEGGLMADLGAGTGNYSIALARLFPHARVLHIDNNKTMNARAAKKAAGLPNFRIINGNIQQLEIAEQSLQGLLCINALYTFPQPLEVLKQIYHWLIPGSRAIFLDPGRVMNVLSWKLAISWRLISLYGIKKTLEIFRESKIVGQQNAYIREMQKTQVYWTHSHEEFCDAIQSSGLQIEKASICFRGDCDLVLAKKP